MGRWVVEYWDEDLLDFVAFQATWDQTNEELDGDCYASFYIANSPENRALIQRDLLVAVWFDDTLVFSGTLCGGDIGSKKIKAVIYDTVMLTLDEAEPISGVYDQKPASTIAADLVVGTGISVGNCPSTPVSVVFYNANRLDCFKFLSDALNLDLYSANGVAINLATKGEGVVWTPSSISVSNRGLDRSKQRTKVVVRGIDCWGYHILGVAGSGTKVKTFSQNTVTDEATLNGIAAKKLAELNTDSSGAPVSVLITVGKGYLVGDSVTVANDQYLLNGTYRIKQLNKTRTQVKMQLDKFRKSLDRTIEDLRSWEDQGIYLPGSTSWSLNLQGLVGLYHLNEGTGTVAKDSSPQETPVDGTITNGSWEEGPITKMLTLAGDGYVDVGDSVNFHALSGVGKFSVGAWFSPSASDSTDRNIMHKADQFLFRYKVSTGVLTFGFRDSAGTWHYYNSDANVVLVGGRLNVVATYDGAHLKLYVNGNLHKEFDQTTNIYDSANKVYLGMFLKGVLAEVMLWNRCLVAQEVLELYFFPLLRVVKKGSGAGASSGWFCTCLAASGGSVDPTDLVNVASGDNLEVEATSQNLDWVFDYWLFDGDRLPSLANPISIVPQLDLSYHTLVAVFLQIGSEFSGQIINIDDGELFIEEKFHKAAALRISDTWIFEDAGKWCENLRYDDDFARVDAIIPDVTSGEMGNNSTSSSSTSCINTLVGSLFTSPGLAVKIANISAYVLCSTANKTFKAAIYKHSNLSLIAQSIQITVTANASAQRIVMPFTSSQSALEASTDYLLIIWCNSASGSGAIYYTAGAADQGHSRALTYGAFPNPFGTVTHNNNAYCLHATYYVL